MTDFRSRDRRLGASPANRGADSSGRSFADRVREGPGAGLRTRLPALLTGVLALLVWVGCASKKVSRIDPEAVTDLSGRWNDTDSRLVARALIEQSFESGWAERHTERNGGETPAVIVGRFANRTMEHIPVNTFLNDLERALLNSGRVRVVASQGEREEIRAEREDQQEHARADTRAELGRELGADYILQGELQGIEDEEGREKIIYYQVDANLVDLESNVKVWAGQYRIKKYIERRGIGL